MPFCPETAACESNHVLTDWAFPLTQNKSGIFLQERCVRTEGKPSFRITHTSGYILHADHTALPCPPCIHNTTQSLDLKPQNQNHSLPQSTDSENILQPLLLPLRLPLRNLMPHLPILVVKIPVLLSRRLAPALRKPPGHKLLSVRLSLPPRRTLLLLDAVLLRSRKVVLAVFHRALIRAETRIGKREHRAEFLIDGIERDDERREVERDTRWTRVSLPDEESLVVVVLGVLGTTFVDVCVLESGGEARVDLVVPAAADTPADAALGVEHLAYDLVGGRCFPTAGLEVELAHFARRPVLDFHHAVIVDSGVTGDDSDHRGGDLFPGVELLLTASRGRAKAEEPGPEWVDVEGLAVEFRLYG